VRNISIFITLCVLTFPCFSSSVTANEDESRTASLSKFKTVVAPIFSLRCNGCHAGKEPEGELDLTQLDPDMSGPSAARWAFLLTKVTKGEMPPEGELPLSAAQIETISAWIQGEMKRNGKHVSHRATYDNGNVVPHEMLFGAKPQVELDSPSRARRLSPEIYREFTREVSKRSEELSQPFTPNSGATFADMGVPKIDEPTTQTLINNALRIVHEQTNHTLDENGKPKKIGFVSKEFLRLFDQQDPANEEEIAKAISMQFDRVLRRPPSDDELARFLKLYHKNVDEAGRVTGVRYTLATVFLLPDAIYRWETARSESTGEAKVSRLAPREIAFALSFALTDKRPQGWLLEAAKKGELDTTAGVQTAVRRMLADEKLAKPRILRFFRQYFEYDRATEVFKDSKRYSDHHAPVLIEDTDRLVEYILADDKQVLYELLTTNKSFVAYRIAEDVSEKRAAARKEFEEKKKKDPKKYEGKMPRKIGKSIYEAYNLSDFPKKQPVTLPANERAGILTQPSWLVAWSKSDDNDAIHRGKWVRERLLGGVVPDIPITVDAQLPDAPDQTLRQRMSVTREQYCWNCHTYMNRVGLPFESYDHIGRYRKTEPVLDFEATEKNLDPKGNHLGDIFKELPVDSTGGFEHVPDPKLKGDVKNATELVRKLAGSEFVEQVFVRHAFRYWLGRNETLGDASSLQAAHRAYRENNGSMNELIVALLSSDSFLYRYRE